jgi:hypothetical protein
MAQRIYEARFLPASGGFGDWQEGEWSEFDGATTFGEWLTEACEGTGCDVEFVEAPDSGAVYGSASGCPEGTIEQRLARWEDDNRGRNEPVTCYSAVRLVEVADYTVRPLGGTAWQDNIRTKAEAVEAWRVACDRGLRNVVIIDEDSGEDVTEALTAGDPDDA